MADVYNQALKIAEQIKRLKLENKLDDWKPYGTQMEFLACTAKKKALISGNQCGKTQTLMYECAIHLTGRYPSWWKGIRYDRPVQMWVVGVTTDKVRDNLQKALIGDVGSFGTGYIPKDALDFENGFTRKPGIPDAFQKVKVKHKSGGFSQVQFFSYEQSREYFQSSTIDIVAFDEEPPLPINNECRIRVMVKGGYMMYAFTPLTADPQVCRQLLNDEGARTFSISMDEVPWLSEEMINEMLHGLSDMEKRARRFGIPASGSGTIYQFDPKEYSCESFEIPSHWPRMGGLDIGYNHPTGAVALAHDRDSGTLYIYQEYKAKERSAVEVARVLRGWGVQFATSHDAFNNTFQHGNSTSDIFKDEGLRCFSAERDPWGRIEKVRSLIYDGRLFIFKDKCPELMKEMLTYHTKTGDTGKIQIFKKNEDVIDALAHSVMFYEKAELKGSLGPQTPNYTIKQWEPMDKRYGI